MSLTYLTTDELSARIKYTPQTIRCSLKDSVLLEGRHYIRPFGGRKVLYIWEHIEQDMAGEDVAGSSIAIPMSNGGTATLNTSLASTGRLTGLISPFALLPKEGI